MANASILAAFERMWNHIVLALNNKADSEHTQDWDTIENRPFGEVPGTDTVYWDGNREGLIKADGYDRYLVSTAVPTLADFENGASNTKLLSGTESTSNLGMGTAIYEAGDGCIVVGNTIVALKDGASLGDEVFPKKGTYFTWIGNDSYTVSLTINGYTGFLVTKKIDMKYLPDDIGGSPANVGPTPIVTTGDGAEYIATIEGVTELYNGLQFVMIPHTNSTTTSVKLNVNGLGAKLIRQRLTTNTSIGVVGATDNWIVANKPVTVTYNDTAWMVEIPRADANNLYGTVKVENGGVPGTSDVAEGAVLRNVDGVPTWNELTAADVGAAPGGYGYGEGLIGLGSTSDDAAFTAKLSEQFVKTANRTRQFYFTHGGGAFLGTLWNAGNNYGVLVATSYAEPNVGYRFKQMVRVCTNGTWGAWVDNSPTAFAPAGYGLGTYGTENKITSKSALDDFKKNGWFVFLNESAPLVVCGLNCSYAYGRVDAYNGSRAKMTITPVVPEKATTFVRYLLSDGKWSAWKPAGTTMELLWTNASPTSSFDAQTVSLALNDYSQVLVYFRVYNGSGTYSEETFGVHGLVGNWCMAVCNSETGSTPAQRAFQITTTGIAFNKAYYAASFGGALSWSSNLLIPTKIYGIKGVS